MHNKPKLEGEGIRSYFVDKLPANPKSQYLEIQANHLSTPSVASDAVIEWIKKTVAPLTPTAGKGIGRKMIKPQLHLFYAYREINAVDDLPK